MRESRIKKTKTVCTYCGVGCSFDIWTKGRNILKVEPQMEAPANQISTCVKGKFGWDFVNSTERTYGTADPARATHSVQATWDEALDYVANAWRNPGPARRATQWLSSRRRSAPTKKTT